jgi:YrbI family 3-deoxy-D-manno-octulosonate 8-phosphate phosphatase
MGIREVHKGCKDKATALRSISEQNAIPLEHICFIGDDVNDLEAMRIAGFSAAPANAQPAVLAEARLTLSRNGGDGAVRELVDHILASRQRA